MKRPLERIIPCSNLKIEIPRGVKAKGLKALMLGENISFTNNGNSVSFELPVLEDYEVVSIEI